jgi:hypothetical protein
MKKIIYFLEEKLAIVVENIGYLYPGDYNGSGKLLKI